MIGSHHIHLATVDSTNRHARDLLRDGPPEGTIVTADVQTAGRGRLDRQWHSDAGRNLLLSIILYPSRPQEEWGGLPLLAGVAVARAVHAAADVAAHVKWPNDVLVGSKKLSGILLESGRLGERPWAIVGIGVNVNQERFEGSYRMPPTSMLLESGGTHDIDTLRGLLCGELDTLYEAWTREGNRAVIVPWKEASRMLCKRVRVEDGERTLQGRAIDLADDGALVVEWENGERGPLHAGDVTVREEES